MRYTNDPSNLILPTLATIKHIAKREKLGELTEQELDFVWDLLAKTGGAQVAEFDEDALSFDAGLDAMLKAEALIKHHPDMANNFDVTWTFKENYKAMQRELHTVLVHLDLTEIPGYNHPTKAVRIVKLLRQLRTAVIIMIIDIEFNEGAFLQMIRQAIQQVQAMSAEDKKLLEKFADPLSENPEEDAEFLGIELQLNGTMDLQEVLRIARHLDTIDELARDRKLTSDPNGEDMKLRGIRDLSELGRVGQQDLALPHTLRIKRAVEGELSVRDPHTRRNKKQLLYLVVDGTASMLGDGATSASRAAGVVMNRLQAVIDGEAEVYVRFFDRDLRDEEFHAHDAKSARELMSIIADPVQYKGGHTVFTTTLSAASNRVEELMRAGKLKEPELVLVTDGIATLPDISVLQGNKMHAIQVGPSEVEGLSELARQSGGVGIYAGVPEPSWM